MSLCLRNASLALDGKPVLFGVDLALESGRMLTILGPNGSGKTSCLTLLSGERPPSTGEAVLDGLTLSSLGAAHLADRRAVMPQRDELAFAFTVREVVQLGVPPSARRDESGTLARLMEQAAAEAGILHLLDRRIVETSGGERQRVTFARALLQILASPVPPDRRIFLLDEPTSALDYAHAATIMGTLRTLAREGVAIACVLHDLTLAARFSDDVVILDEGRIEAAGSVSACLRSEVLEPIYGIAMHVGQIDGEIVVYPRHGAVGPAAMMAPRHRQGHSTIGYGDPHPGTTQA